MNDKTYNATLADRDNFIEESAALLDAMANSHRLRVLTHLIGREVSVGALSDLVGISQSALSQHLSKLRSAGLVTTRREAQSVYYTCRSSAVMRMLQLLSTYFTK